MRSKGLMTWLIPVAALVVPGFLFYNWWSTLNANTKRELEKKVRANPGLAVFIGGSVKPQLKNPLAPQPAVPVAQSTQTVAGVAVSTQTVNTAAVPAVSSATAATPATPAAASGLAQSTAAANGGGLGDAVVISRDPTLSPYDVVRIEQSRLERDNNTHAIIAAARRPVKKPTEPPIEDSIELQGIIGKEAIVNGERYGEGEIVNRAKIVKITPSSVQFVYKNRKFSKSLGD